ncbi:EpsG family protein [uncultured Coprobacter sp.]|uniref:EpsG family protein n=1 Tax=Coprobacter secundus TaxID=1501392 RepID=UPI00259882C9|nr:EpsG family protein [uncultured Coprobacter sp.]
MVLDARVQYIFLYNFLLLLTLGVFLSYIGRTGRYVPCSYESKRYTVFLLLFMIVIIGWRDWIDPLFVDSAGYGLRFSRIHSLSDDVWGGKSKLFNGLYVYWAYFNLSPELFFMFSAMVYCLPMYYLSRKIGKNYSFIVLLFFATNFIWYSFGVNGIRNGWAFAMILWTIYYWNKNILFFLFLFLAYCIHGSSILTIGAILVSKFFPKPKFILLFWFLSFIFSLLVGRYVEDIFLKYDFISSEGQGYLAEELTTIDPSVFSYTGFRWDFLIYSSIPVFWGYYAIVKNKATDLYYNFIYGTYVLANAIWVLVIRSNYSNRIASLSWFLIPLVFAYPLVRMNTFKNHNRALAIVILLYYLFAYFMWIRS